MHADAAISCRSLRRRANFGELGKRLTQLAKDADVEYSGEHQSCVVQL
ncbi:hypothetical protein RBSH_05495 [Rhodopirellula baltica SH28]|uniref:Uncharacterized protein n=3 Tax=Rhodopirellula baltica TaxID=265606 RepID=F2ARV4_RHOBT|nr:hypothetical protein RBWH47_04369 [Rhodopirellula baltica WH47]EKJ99186.1 hypothetical protein RBSH_05495 [Rhodopirellula baltica SH28]ELP35227.1 hypothetical protein RBSWK_00895 [Rhodopirellula baltica SWK14]